MSQTEMPELIGIVFDSGLKSGDFRRAVCSMQFCGEVYVPVKSLEDPKVSDIHASGAKPLIVENISANQCLDALKNSGAKWVLIIDDREIVPENLQSSIPELIKEVDNSAFIIPRKHLFEGQDVSALLAEEPSASLADLASTEIRSGVSCHRLIDPSPAKKADAYIERMVFDDFSDCVKWMDIESDRMAQQAFSAGRKPAVVASLFAGAGIFMNRYFFKGGRKLGIPGLFLCVNLGMLRFITAVKLRELTVGAAKVPV